MKYRKRPVEIEAVLWNGRNIVEIEEFCGARTATIDIDEHLWEAGVGAPIIYLRINTLEGSMKADVGDYIIKGVKGEFYPCKPDIFRMTYEKVEE